MTTRAARPGRSARASVRDSTWGPGSATGRPPSAGRGLLGQPRQLRAQRAAIEAGGSRACDHHDVDVSLEPCARAPEPLPDAPLDAIANDRSADLPARRDPQTRCGPLACSTRSGAPPWRNEHHEIARRYADALPGHALEIPREQDPVRPPQALGHRSRLLGAHGDGEPLAALLAPPSQDIATPAGLHAGSEPVLSQSLDPTRLIGALHPEPSLIDLVPTRSTRTRRRSPRSSGRQPSARPTIPCDEYRVAPDCPHGRPRLERYGWRNCSRKRCRKPMIPDPERVGAVRKYPFPDPDVNGPGPAAPAHREALYGSGQLRRAPSALSP